MANDLVAVKERLALDATRYAKQAQQGAEGVFISTRGGVLKVGDEELPGNQLACYILDSVYENTFYGTDYDADNPMPPLCYAFGRDKADMAPHESMQADLGYFKAQSEQCKGCPLNEFGTAEKGRGKACQNRERLIVIPAGVYERIKGTRDFQLSLLDDPAALAEIETAYLKLPVTSVKNYDKYVKAVSASMNLPPYAVITRVFTVPDDKSQYQIAFELIDAADDAALPILVSRHDAAEASIEVGYQPPESKAQVKPGKALAAEIRGLHK